MIRAARELDLPIVALRSRDEADAPHARMADEVVVLDGEQSGAFLDAAAMVGVVVRAGCAAVRPGHGLLAENADFAQRCTGAGLTWVRPRPKVLRTLGDKTSPKRGGHREVIDAIAFEFQTGTQWVHLPEKYGNWRGVYNRRGCGPSTVPGSGSSPR